MPLDGELLRSEAVPHHQLVHLPRRDDVRGFIAAPYHHSGMKIFLLEHWSISHQRYLWGFPGGGVKEGESYIDALHREIGREEVASRNPLMEGDWRYHVVEGIEYITSVFPTPREGSLIAKQSHFFPIITDSNQGLMADPNEKKLRRGAFFEPELAYRLLPFKEQRQAFETLLPQVYRIARNSSH